MNYPLLDIFLSTLYFFLWVLWIFLLVRIITDVFRSSDLSGLGKAGWTLLLIVMPLFGALIYLIVRGTSMHLRENRQAQANDQALRHYVQGLAGPGTSTADELEKLAALRDRGVVTEQEFTEQKAHLLGARTS
jgi:hypothetical protein